MHLRFHIAALAAALLLSSCSDDPVRTPGAPNALYQTATVEMYASDINAVWGRSADDLYVSGDAFLHFDGSEWRPIELPQRNSTFRSIWEDPTGDINVVGSDGMYRYDGSQWERILVPRYLKEWWSSPDGQLFVLDFSRSIVRYDGAVWTELDSLPSIEGDIYINDSYYALAGDAADNIFAVGAMGTIAHFDGSSWSAASYRDQITFEYAWKISNGPLYLSSWNDTLYAFDGAGVTAVDLGVPFRTRELSGNASNIFVSGWDDSRGCWGLITLEGTQWQSIACMGNVSSSYCAWRAPTGEAFVGARNGLLRIDGGEITTPLGSSIDRGDYFADIWGSEEDGLFAVGYRAVRYVDGEWSDLHKESITMEPAYAVWGTSARDLWAVGRRMILHYDGASWAWVSSANQKDMEGVWANKKEVLAVGSDGTIMRSDHETWEVMPSPTTTPLTAVWGWDGGAFAAGWEGIILRYDGTSWKTEESPVSWTILDLFGFGANDVFAVGTNPFEVCHFNGREWLPQDTGLYVGTDNRSIWGTSGDNLFVLNAIGGIIHYDGSSWTPLPRYAGGLSSLWGTDRGDLFVAGGGIFRYSR